MLIVNRPAKGLAPCPSSFSPQPKIDESPQSRTRCVPGAFVTVRDWPLNPSALGRVRGVEVRRVVPQHSGRHLRPARIVVYHEQMTWNDAVARVGIE